MTKKQIDDLAETLANKVIEKLESRRKKWDEEYHEEMKAQGYELMDDHFEGIVPSITKLLNLEDSLSHLQKLLNTALAKEDYQLCASIDRNIAKLNEEIINCKRNTNK